MNEKYQPNILIVDDIRDNLVLLDHIIQPLEVNPILAMSGFEALEKIQGKELFLALIDVKMPHMDGIELVRRLRSDPAHRLTPVIFITAFADNEILRDCYKAGAVDFISKPFQQYILLSKVKIFLELHKRKLELLSNQRRMQENALELENINESLRRSQEELAELTVHLEDVREDERKKIALDLHDDLGQRLTAHLMDLAWIKKNLSGDNQHLIAKIEGMKNAMEDTINTVRKISMGLRPSALDDLGLVPALKWLFGEYKNNTGIPVVYDMFPEELDIDPKLSILIYRVVQEILTNVARHADAAKINFILKPMNDGLFIQAVDDGTGIADEKIFQSGSFGLRGIRERVSSWGGTLEIFGNSSTGTRVSIFLPVIKKSE